MPEVKKPSSRLEFTEDERADPTLQKYIDRSDNAADKLDGARAAIPTKKVIRRERTFDETTGKGKTRLHFEEVEKKPSGKLHHNPLSRPMQELKTTAHGKIRQVEHENVGVEAGHKGELLTEHGVTYTGSKVRSAIRHRRMKPWRQAEKAEKAAIKANAEFFYQKAIHDDPSLAASNPVSRYVQKQRIKRNYAKQVRKAEQNTKKAARTAKSAAVRAKEAVKQLASFVASNWKAILIVIGIAMIVFLLVGGISSCTMMLSSGTGSIMGSSYLSEDEDIYGAENAYLALEDSKRQIVENIRSYYPGYDEYNISADQTEHDPYILISMLSALHDGEFTLAAVQNDLLAIFDLQYSLTVRSVTETRYRMEVRTGERTVTDPDTGETYTEEYEYEVEVPYRYYILNVSFENAGLETVPAQLLSKTQLTQFATYMATLGNRQDLFPDSKYNTT